MGVQTDSESTWWNKTQLYLNALNHMLIAVVAFYTIRLCIQAPASIFVTHIWTCTLGYNLLMCESIMSLYNRNSWSQLHGRRAKNHLHWILQALGSTFAFVGMFVLYIERGFIIQSVHAITGFISNVLIVLAVINGSSALWAAELRGIFKPVYTKFVHNLTGSLCFVVGMVSLIYGFALGPFRNNSTPDTVLAMQSICGITILFTMIGPVKSMWSQCVGVYPSLGQLTRGKDTEQV